MGMAMTSMTEQVLAGMPVESLRTPANIPPIIPPTSKRVDTLALTDAPKLAAGKQMGYCTNF